MNAVSRQAATGPRKKVARRGAEARGKLALDVCCGSRMFWFDRKDDRALFVDKRREVCTADTREGRRQIVVDPDIIANFAKLPFADNSFSLVVFDPPHTFAGKNGWTAKKYGRLEPGWREEISAGFAECFRVLCRGGTLVFKWNEHRVPVATVLSMTEHKPLFGQRCGTTAKTHWLVFMKPDSSPVDPWPRGVSQPPCASAAPRENEGDNHAQR